MKNIIKTLVLVMTLALVLVAFAACEQECVHQGGTATCTEKAVCELCGESYGSALGHKDVFTGGLDATCTEGGYTVGQSCSVCGQVLVPVTEIPAQGHDMEDMEGQAPTCTAAGYTAYQQCKVCEAIEGLEEIPATGHIDTDADYVCDAEGCDVHVHSVGEDGVCAGCETVLVTTAEQLIAAIGAGQNVLLMNNIEMDATLKCPYGNAVGVAQKGGVLDGNGYTLTVKGSGNYYAIITYGGTIKNLTINSGFRAIVLYTPTEDVIIDNVTIYGDNIVYGLNTAEYPTLEGIDIVVKNSSICGWISFAGDYASVSFENCKFTQGVAYDNVIGRLVRPYLSTTFTNCEFVKNAYLDLSALNAGETVTLVGCTVDGVEVTLDVFTTEEDSAEYPFTYEAPAGVELVLATVEGGVSFHRHGHVVTETVPSSCTVAGKEVYTCACGDSYESELALGEHDYDHVVTAPTCTAAGYTTHTCVFCDDSYTDTEVAALGHADDNGDYKCDKCSTKMLPADGTALTIPQALAIAKLGGTAYTTQKYYITGIVTNVYNTTYGNLYLKDADGNEICIYGLYSADGKTRYDAMSYKPVEGDELTVYTVLGTYNSTPQGKNAWMDDVVAHEHNYVAVVTDPTCTKEGYTTHTCSICNGYYTDSETAALGHTTEAGTCERCGQTLGGDTPVYETFIADFNTITSTNSSYVSSKTTSGWQATNCAVMGGGTSDSNPKFKVFGDAATRAFTMNGKTSAKGKIVSPTLTGGISALSFNFTNCFSESNGVDITITIKQNGTAVATKKLDQNSVTKLTAYTFEWDLAGEGVAVTGDFTIEITNNSPSNSTSNKDRVSIWNLEWTNNPTA